MEGIQALVDKYSIVVLFNAKFDLHWFRNAGIDLSNKLIYDCQVAEFILSHQTHKFPSLNECSEKYLGQFKIDVVKENYWAKGINTDAIPWDILSEYAEEDARLTYGVFFKQWELMTPRQRQLYKIQCMDTHILAEMEWNGLLYDVALCEKRSLEIDDQVSEIKAKLSSIYPDVPINFGSPDHLSAFLYGGIVKQEVKEHVGFFKGGKQAGQPKYRNAIVEHVLPRVYEPIKGTALKKEGLFGTAEDVLKKLKGNKTNVELLLKLAELEKLNGTYYKGLPKLNKEMNWTPGVLHGQLNQCVAATGRLSASKPNQQNFASDMQDVFVSRFED